MIFSIHKTFEEITKSDIDLMNTDQVKAYAREAHEIIEHNDIQYEHLGDEELMTDVPNIISGTTLQHLGHQGAVGSKRGKTSKYHYTFWNTSLNAWISQVLINGKKYSCPKSNDEVMSAVKIDLYLDKINDETRPRNYEEFSEILSALPEDYTSPRLQDYFTSIGTAD